MAADRVLYLSAAFHNPPKDICHDANIQQVLLGHYLYCRCCSFADSCRSETLYRRLIPAIADYLLGVEGQDAKVKSCRLAK